MTSWDTLTLSPEHRASLTLSAITPEVAAARGYYTATTPEQMPECFSPAQRKRVPALVLPVWGVDDTAEPITYRMRPDVPMTDNRGRGEGTVRKYEQPAKVALRLDVPPSVRDKLADPNVPLVLTEGEKKADAGASAGIVTVSLPGVWGFRGTDPDTGGKLELPDLDRIAWNGRAVYVAFDSDVVEKRQVQQALSRLSGVLTRRGAVVHVLRLPAGGASGKQGLDDVLYGMRDLSNAGKWEALKGFVDPAFWASVEDGRKLDERLRDFITDEYDLGQDEGGNGYGLPKVGPKLVRMLYTGRPSLYMEAPVRFSQADPGKPVIPQRVVKDVISHVEGLCYEQPRTKLHLRSAPFRDRVIIDLGSQSGERIEVTANGWKIIPGDADSDVLFRRSENVTELPVPERGGSLDELRALLNVTDETWPLVLGWLVASVFADVPRPWLFNTGPQGSGKSDAALFLLNVLDPRPALQAPPRKGDRSDPAAVAAATYLLGYDNMTSISQEDSDWLCALVTGATDVRRVLHTTATTQTLSLQRSGILTGISVSGVRADLAERLVTVEFERITGSDRKAHGGLTERFNKAHGRILGALLDAVADVLRWLPSVDGDALDVPRMADYARVLRAYDMARFTDLCGAYRANVLDTFADRAEEDPVAAVILSYVGEHGDTGRVTPGELHQALSHHRDRLVNDGDLQHDSFWPNNARSFGWALRGLVATLEGKVRVEQKRTKEARYVRLSAVGDVLNVTTEQNVTQNVTHETAGQSDISGPGDVYDVSTSSTSLIERNSNNIISFLPIGTGETGSNTSPTSPDDAKPQVRPTITGDVLSDGETSPLSYEPTDTVRLASSTDRFGSSTPPGMMPREAGADGWQYV